MTEESQKPKPLNRTVYPFPLKDDSASADAHPAEPSAQDYFDALSRAEDGFFPIGYNGQWHGGIHFGAETGRLLSQDDGVRCIADGEVIAYRIDDNYPTVPYETCAAARYSSGFVLVKHQLQPPPAPQNGGQEPSTGSGEQQSNTEPSLVLYSLYMHLSNWPSYDTNQELARPAFWNDAIYTVGDRAADSDRETNGFIPATGGIGMNLRDAGNTIAGFAPRGVKLKLGEANPANSAYHRILEVVGGGTTYPTDVTGLYIFKGTATSREGLTSTSQPHAVGTVHVFPEPEEIKAGDLVGHLGQYQRYLDMDPMIGCSDRPLAQIDVFTPEDLQAFIRQSRARDTQLGENDKTLLHVKPGAMLVQPATPDIELGSTEAAILQGESGTDSGWVKGKRGTIDIVSDRPPGFVTSTRTYADGRIFLAAVDASGNELTLEAFNTLTDKSAYTRRKLLTPSGGDIWLDHSAATPGSVVAGPARVWSRFPLQVANVAGEPVAHSNVVSLKSAASSATEEDGTRWFLIDTGTATGDPIQGWARERDHPNVERCSPWAWPGFELFDTGELQPRELFARELSSSRRSTPSEQGAFESSARSVEDSPLFAALGQAIDTDDNKQITPLELRDALKKPWLAQAISRLVIRYPSEWAPPMDRWNQVDSLIEDPALLIDWQHEKRRIESLHIWPHVAGGHGPSNSTVHHL
ncbi:calcium-binding protein, partial [Luteimonas abyssi]|uniref:calcium-binding protein n=1 Tax=Luteimonas abyssi TaxID=1247514 RepID=UPI00138EE0CC